MAHGAVGVVQLPSHDTLVRRPVAAVLAPAGGQAGGAQMIGVHIVYHTFLPHGNSLAVGVVVLLDVRDECLHFGAGRVAHVVAGGEVEGVGVAGLAVVRVVFSPTFGREHLPGSLILPHFQEARARVYAGAAIIGAPGDVHVAALHQRCEGEGGRRGIVNDAKVHAALAAYGVLQGDGVGAAGGVKKAGRSLTIPAL